MKLILAGVHCHVFSAAPQVKAALRCTALFSIAKTCISGMQLCFDYLLLDFYFYIFIIFVAFLFKNLFNDVVIYKVFKRTFIAHTLQACVIYLFGYSRIMIMGHSIIVIGEYVTTKYLAELLI